MKASAEKGQQLVDEKIKKLSFGDEEREMMRQLKKNWVKKVASIKTLQEASSELYRQNGGLKAEIKKLEGKLALACLESDFQKTTT